MPDTIQVQVRIERQTKYGDYHDALYFPVDDFYEKDGTRKITDEQIEQAAKQRVANYERNIEEARKRPPAPEPTAEEMFGAWPVDQIAKFEVWLAAKRGHDVPTLAGPSAPDSIVTPKVKP